MQRVFTRWMGILAVTTLLASCASTSLVDFWHNPGLVSDVKYHKLLIYSISGNANERRVYEDVIAAGLIQRGIEAETSYGLMPEDQQDKRLALEKAVKQTGAEAVVSIQTTMFERKTSVEPGYISGYADFWYPPDFQRWNMSGYFGARGVYEPPRVYAYTVATMQANLFDVASGKLIWAASIETSEPGRVLTVSKEVAKIIIQMLIQEGLI